MSGRPKNGGPASTADELRDLIREANSTTKALRAAERDARQARKELVEAVAHRVDEVCIAAVKEHVDVLQSEAAATRDAQLLAIEQSMTGWANLCMYGNRKGEGENIFEQLRTHAERARKRISP